MADVDHSLAWRVFSMPKAGHGRDEYEDAYAGDPAAGRFAIADGASESAFAGAWANLLVKGFTQQAGSWSRWMPAGRKTWQQTYQGREFSWYTEEKFLQGAYATFLGVSFHGAGGRWRALAVGDCCLFHVRSQRLLRAFPVRHASAFGNRPDLIGSRQSSNKSKRALVEGYWQEQDHMLLMTDALAQWFLQKVENDQQPWKEVLSVATQDAFDAWIKKMREGKEVRNDDVTLMVIG